MRIVRPEQRVYRLLCSWGALRSSQIARKLKVDPASLDVLLRALDASGEVVRVNGRWTPTVPW